MKLQTKQLNRICEKVKYLVRVRVVYWRFNLLEVQVGNTAKLIISI